MDLRPFVVGLGRSGAGLHVPALARAGVSSARPLGYDPQSITDPPVRRVGAIEEAAALTPPSRTVVHLCVPPGARPALVDRLARLGYRRFLMEKPLAVTEADRALLNRLVRRYRLDVVVVAQWLASGLTGRVASIVRGGRLGRPVALRMVQHKPRFGRSLASQDHPTAFDVELPHGLGLVLHLAGPATIRAAGCADLVLGRSRLPRLGSAWVSLAHDSGVRTLLSSDLTAPVRARTLTVHLEHGTVRAHYPVSEADNYAQLETEAAGERRRIVFPDDAFASFVRQAYRHFRGSGRLAGNLCLHDEVTAMLGRAKELSGGAPDAS